MASGQGLKGSLQLQLSLWLLVSIAGVALLAGVLAFVAAFKGAHDLQDDALRATAALVETQYGPAAFSGTPPISSADRDSRVFVQPLSQASSRGEGTQPLHLPASLPEGIQTRNVAGISYRILVKTLHSGQRIAVAQETEARDEIARDSALGTLAPFLMLLPFLLLLVAHLVRTTLRPVATLASEIDTREVQALHPLEEKRVPAEIRPFVTAINRLLARVAEYTDLNRRMVANAAHELRSPMTALSLQAERLEKADMSPEARVRLASLRGGIERQRTLLDQLLTLARVQSPNSTSATSIQVQAVFRLVLEDLVPLAEAKGIDVGVVGEEDCRLAAHEVDLITLIKNIVENAIRYTPPGGRVDLSVKETDTSLQIRIEDTGPGIPLEERERVFEPFYRRLGHAAPGAGLGLAIVKVLLERLQGTIELAEPPLPSTGLIVVLTLPKALSPAA